MTAGLLAVALAAVAAWLVTGPAVSAGRLRALGDPVFAAEQGSLPTAPVRGLTRAWHRLRRGRAENAARRLVEELCTGLVAELRAGRTPAEALRLSVDALPASARAAFGQVVAVASRGGDVPGALRTAAAGPGHRALGWLAACWQVGVESGAGLAEAVERLAASLRDEQRARREVTAQLAAPRATARLLALLPVLGIVLGTSLGQRPLAFLFGSPYGLACLAAGVGIDLLGVLWTVRLAKAAEVPA
ncbi:MAG: hypothetical protein GEV10_06245 [Streptosporangiales bacterium]|nr:hypothetical protein [Streptosporangiales bacterium]